MTSTLDDIMKKREHDANRIRSGLAPVRGTLPQCPDKREWGPLGPIGRNPNNPNDE